MSDTFSVSRYVLTQKIALQQQNTDQNLYYIRSQGINTATTKINVDFVANRKSSRRC